MDFSTFENIAKNTATEEGVFARFYDKAIKTDKVNDKGLPEFKEVCYCEIRIKDNNTEVYDQPASNEKIRRFHVEYARYQILKKQSETGTPLEQFAFLTRAEVEMLKFRGISTVEALASLEEAKANGLGISKERGLAIKFLNNAKVNCDISIFEKLEKDLRDEIEKLKLEKESLVLENKSQRDEIEKLKSKKKA